MTFIEAKELLLVSFCLHWDLVCYNKCIPFKISWLSENASCLMWSKERYNSYSYMKTSRRTEEGHGQSKQAVESFSTKIKFI